MILFALSSVLIEDGSTINGGRDSTGSTARVFLSSLAAKVDGAGVFLRIHFPRSFPHHDRRRNTKKRIKKLGGGAEGEEQDAPFFRIVFFSMRKGNGGGGGAAPQVYPPTLTG
jgi:hypothetical protein